MKSDKSWAAGYLHRAVQLARDEALRQEQVDAAARHLEWLLSAPSDREDCRSGATVAGADVRTLADGQREWVLFGGPNYRTAGNLLTAHTNRREQARLMGEFLRVVSGRAGVTSGAGALVARLEQKWRTGVTEPAEIVAPSTSAAPEAPPAKVIAPVTPPAPATLPVELVAPVTLPAHEVPVLEPRTPVPQHAPAALPFQVATPTTPLAPERAPVVDEADAYAFAVAPEDLPLPDTAWFEAIIRHEKARFRAGEADDPSGPAAQRQRIWAETADWLREITLRALGPRWIAPPGKWQMGGNLYGYYWAKVHPREHPLRSFFNVGIQITHKPKWIKYFDDSLLHFKSVPVLALWATTNDDMIKRYREVDPEFVARAREIYRQIQMDAFEASPELWVEGGALVRYYLTEGHGHLTTARDYLKSVKSGRLRLDRSTPSDLWSPLLPLTEAVAEPRRAANLIFSYLRILGKVLADTYDQIGDGPAADLVARVRARTLHKLSDGRAVDVRAAASENSD